MPHLFSYGTLQQEDVQVSTFGRKLNGHADVLTGFQRTLVEIRDEDVILTSGTTHHPIIRYSGNAEDHVDGTVFEVTDQELANADSYEVDDYKRVSVKLDSGTEAWVYVDARLTGKP